MNPNEDTVLMVPLADLTALARLGVAMRRAQKAYFVRRASAPHVSADAELQAAKAAEKRFDTAAKAALERDHQSLPGMGGEGGDTA